MLHECSSAVKKSCSAGTVMKECSQQSNRAFWLLSNRKMITLLRISSLFFQLSLICSERACWPLALFRHGKCPGMPQLITLLTKSLKGNLPNTDSFHNKILQINSINVLYATSSLHLASAVTLGAQWPRFQRNLCWMKNVGCYGENASGMAVILIQ